MIALLSQAQDWSNRTNVHLGGLAFALLLGYVALLAPRRHALFALLTLACFVPAGQRVTVFTLDFSFLRLMLLVYWIRLFVRNELRGFRLHALDLLVVLWAVVQSVAYTVTHGTLAALVFKLGDSFDALGYWFVFRLLLRGWRDLDRVALILTGLAIPCCAVFIVERMTGKNLFSVFGGVPWITDVREGRMRCQGAFSHPIVAGCFWAAAMPLIGARYMAGGAARAWSVVGLVCAAVIVGLTASSTPLAAMVLGALAAFSFSLRRFFRAGRLALVAGLVVLHLVMNGPVWYLVARATLVGGSTGWHRFLLIDAAIRHFGEWWLVGTPDTTHWGLGLHDVTNQFVLEAVRGGLAGLVCFLATIAVGFHLVGRTWRRAWPSRRRVALVWALGVSLFAQCAAFVGVSYFGQIWVIWFLVLAGLASMDQVAAHAAFPALGRRALRTPRPADAGTGWPRVAGGSLAPEP